MKFYLAKNIYYLIILTQLLMSVTSFGNQSSIVVSENPGNEEIKAIEDLGDPDKFDSTEIPINPVSVLTNDKMMPRYWLYNRDIRNIDKEISAIPNCYWNIYMIGVNQRDTKVLFHGWKANRFSRFSTQLKDTFLDQMDVNIIVVDWSGLAFESYDDVMENLNVTAGHIAHMFSYLSQHQGMDLSRMHFLGFGLGAHLTGLVCKKLAPKKIDAITALDPVSLMSKLPPSKRLCPFDAKYVEVIHTGSRRFLGPSTPLGHADFYPNGGKLQPGCGVDLLASCSGERALDLYLASIQTDRPAFMGIKCKTLLEAVQKRCSSIVQAKMGGRRILRAYGLYYLETTDKPPFY